MPLAFGQRAPDADEWADLYYRANRVVIDPEYEHSIREAGHGQALDAARPFISAALNASSEAEADRNIASALRILERSVSGRMHPGHPLHPLHQGLISRASRNYGKNTGR